MSFEWSQLLTWRMLANVLDIIVVWYFVYKLIMLIRGTKAVQLFKGIIVIALIKVISWYIGLRTVSYIMDQFISWNGQNLSSVCQSIGNWIKNI